MINVTKTYLPPINEYNKYIDEIFSSNWITNNGPMVNKLERRLKEYLGVKNILLVSNGTLALQIAYRLLGLKGEVITTPFSFVATTSSLQWEGLKPIFADIKQDNFCINPDEIEGKITDKTTAIVPVHVFGNCCDVEKIDRIAKKYKLKVIYDAAHSFGVRYKGSSILNFGDISILSFHATKLFHTIEGGALIINDDKLYERCKKIINFGIGASPTEIDEVGTNAKMNEFQAAMGHCVLDNINEIIKKRREVFNFYNKYLTKENNVICIESSNFSYYPILFKSEGLLHKTLLELNNNNIFPRRYFYPSLDTLSYINSDIMSISNDISRRILCLPLYDSLEENDQHKIINIIRECIKE